MIYCPPGIGAIHPGVAPLVSLHSKVGLKFSFACTVNACDKICDGGRHREGKWGRGGVLNSPRANSSATVQIVEENIVVQYSGGGGGFVPYSSDVLRENAGIAGTN